VLNRKIIFISLFLFSVLLLAFVLSTKNRYISVEKLPPQAFLLNARPLVWLDDQYLLVGFENKIVKFDTSNQKIVNVILENYYVDFHECFTPEGGLFATSKEPENGKKITSFSDIQFHWIQDWKQPQLFDELKTVGWYAYPHDCTPREYKETVLAKEQADRDKKSSYSYLKPDGKVLLTEENGSIKQIDLRQTKSSFDRTSRNYFWYMVSNNFDRNDSVWPLTGWWVSPDGKIINEITIPGGPWLKPFSDAYKLQYFSCGPSCYSHMQMYVGSGSIYIYIWGEAVDGLVQGIYRLNDVEKKWDKLITGEVDNGLVISPNGCDISYAVSGKMRIMDVCKK